MMVELSSGMIAIIAVVVICLIYGALEIGFRDGWKAAKLDTAKRTG